DQTHVALGCSIDDPAQMRGLGLAELPVTVGVAVEQVHHALLDADRCDDGFAWRLRLEDLPQVPVQSVWRWSGCVDVTAVEGALEEGRWFQWDEHCLQSIQVEAAAEALPAERELVPHNEQGGHVEQTTGER